MRMIRKHAIWVILAMLVGLAGASLALSGRGVKYTSAAAVDVEPRIIANSVPVTPNLATEEKIATSGDVLGAAAATLGMDTGHLAADVTVSVTGTSTILSIGCTMPQPAAAQHCATVVTQAYISFRNDLTLKKPDQARDPLDVTLVSPAVLPLSPAGTKKSVLLSIGAFLGLLLGVGAVYVRDRADDRVRDRSDLSRNLGAPALVTIPRVRRRSAPAAFAFTRIPGGAAAEAYRYLRVRIEALRSANSAQGYVVLVTGPRGGEGSTTIASNLAASLAQADTKVIMVDGNVRNSSLSGLYGATGQPGLTDLLAGTASLGAVTVATDTPGLALIPAGTSPDGAAADIFDAAALARTFGQITAAANIVVVDSAPVLEVSDPVALAAVSRVIVVVADTCYTTRSDIRVAAQELASSGHRHVLGVLTRAPRGLRRRMPRSGSPVGRQGSGSAGKPGGQAAGEDQPSSANGHGSDLRQTSLAAQGRLDDDTIRMSRVTAEIPDQ
jgi:capsular exopolysaccharide synthesis family protein